MNYELWAASVTSYRRRGIRGSDLRALFERGMTVDAIYEPFRFCHVGDSPEEVRSELERLDFDIVGVGDPETGRVEGWIERDSIFDESWSEGVHPIDPRTLVSDSTPLIDLFSMLVDRPWALVVAGQGVTGIVTRADLHKPPVRAMLFGILSLIELHLTFWIARAYGARGWREALGSGRLLVAEELLEARRKRREEIGLLDCLQFCDKRDLVAGHAELRERLALGSRRAATRFLREAERLRDRVAHSQPDLVAGSTWDRLAETVRESGALLDRSDDLIEELSEGEPTLHEAL